jgi:hypothetical protein
MDFIQVGKQADYLALSCFLYEEFVLNKNNVESIFYNNCAAAHYA